jgi:hypothetical protein
MEALVKIDMSPKLPGNSGPLTARRDFDDFAQQYDCPLACDIRQKRHSAPPKRVVCPPEWYFVRGWEYVPRGMEGAPLSAGCYSFDASTHFLRTISGLPSQPQHPNTSRARRM